jgi:hypothetical protein
MSFVVATMPPLFRNLQMRYSTCRECGTFQTRYPLWTTVRLSVLLPNNPYREVPYPPSEDAVDSPVGLSSGNLHHIPTFIFLYLLSYNPYNYIIVTDMEGNSRIDKLPLGRVTDQWKWYCPSRKREQYHFHLFVPRPKDSLSILILHFLSVTIVFIALKTRIWHI